MDKWNKLIECVHWQNLKLDVRKKNSAILIATDVASRGLDIPDIDMIINYDIPLDTKSYVHRVGRTARAGKSGESISVVTQYDVENFQKIEYDIGDDFKMKEYENLTKDNYIKMNDEVMEACRKANIDLKDVSKVKGKN